MKTGDKIVWSSFGKESWMGRTGVVVCEKWDNLGQWIDILFDDTGEVSRGWCSNRVDKCSNDTV